MAIVVLSGREPLLNDPVALGPAHSFDGSEITLDLSGLSFVCPLDLTGMAAWSSSLNEAQRGSVSMPPDNVASYLSRMRMFDILRSQGWTIPTFEAGPPQHLPDKLLEVTRLDTFGDVEDLENRLPPLLTGASDDPLKRSALLNAFGELCDNAVTHSGSAFFVAAQRYSGETTGSARLELAVADAGIGVPDHLRRNEKYSDITIDKQAIAAALRKGVTGTLDQRGYGFFDVLDESGQAAEGLMVVHSGRGSARVPFGSKSRRRRYRALPARLAGTWIQIQLWE